MDDDADGGVEDDDAFPSDPGCYHAFGVTGIALSKKISVFQPSSPDASYLKRGGGEPRGPTGLGSLSSPD